MRFRRDYLVVVASIALVFVFLILNRRSGTDLTVVSVLRLSISALLLLSAFIVSLYVNRWLALGVNIFAALSVVIVNSSTPKLALFFGTAATIVTIFVHMVKTEHERLLQEQQIKEQEVQKTLRKLEKVSLLKEEVLFVASHDLRTPVSIIRSNLATIKEGYSGKVNKQTLSYIDAAYRATERLQDLLEDLLEVSTLEHSEDIRLEPVQLEEVIESVVSAHRHAAKHVKIHVPTRPYKSPKVRADERLLQRAFDNLIVNAIKYTPKGEITISVTPAGGKVHCIVQDTGIGISDNERERLFTKFYRGSNAVNQDTRGSGLGLYITKQIVQRLRGEISVESRINKGTTFHILLPVMK
jgi:signal transduction histidine kinase